MLFSSSNSSIVKTYPAAGVVVAPSSFVLLFPHGTALMEEITTY